MKLYDKNGRAMRLTPPPRPADDAQPIGWVGGLAVWGEVNADWAHGQTRTGFVTPAERAAVWATGMEKRSPALKSAPPALPTTVAARPASWARCRRAADPC